LPQIKLYLQRCSNICVIWLSNCFHYCSFHSFCNVSILIWCIDFRFVNNSLLWTDSLIAEYVWICPWWGSFQLKEFFSEDPQSFCFL
jgi:hypothetical protein